MMANELINLITNNGVAVAMLVYFIYDKTQISNKMTDAINNNNLLMQKLIMLLGKEDEIEHE